MITALYSGSTGMVGQQFKLDTITNNLANVDTTGYKRQRAEFVDLYYQYAQNPGVPTAGQTSILPTGIYTGLGTRVAAVNRIFTMGNMEETGVPLDVAITGDGFFQVIMQDGTPAYTRDGSFKVDQNGRIVTNIGMPLAQEIVIPPDAVSLNITHDGLVVVQTMDGDLEEIGQFILSRFINPAGLESIGDNIYIPKPGAGDPIDGIPGQDGFGGLKQHFLEKSNVNVVREMVGMITSQRAYELNSRSIMTADNLLQTVVGLKR